MQTICDLQSQSSFLAGVAVVYWMDRGRWTASIQPNLISNWKVNMSTGERLYVVVRSVTASSREFQPWKLEGDHHLASVPHRAIRTSLGYKYARGSPTTMERPHFILFVADLVFILGSHLYSRRRVPQYELSFNSSASAGDWCLCSMGEG